MEYVQSGTEAIQEAKQLQKKTRKLMCCVLGFLLIIAIVVVLAVVQVRWRGMALACLLALHCILLNPCARFHCYSSAAAAVFECMLLTSHVRLWLTFGRGGCSSLDTHTLSVEFLCFSTFCTT